MLNDRVGLALSHAGVAITVTSLTDFAAFAIGGSTVSSTNVNTFAFKRLILEQK